MTISEHDTSKMPKLEGESKGSERSESKTRDTGDGEKDIFQKTLNWCCTGGEFVPIIEKFFDDECELFRKEVEGEAKREGDFAHPLEYTAS